jgi:NAD(P)-dependent dehydrogenase (short-subunit alcohol dehydrogenase family)
MIQCPIQAPRIEHPSARGKNAFRRAGILSFHEMSKVTAAAQTGGQPQPRRLRIMEDHMSNDRKVVIITGASQGIGAALVKAYRDRNYRVVATSRSIKQTNDPDIVTVRGDIADPATAEAVTREAILRFGRIDALVNNAGIFIAKPFTDYTAEDFNSKIATNLAGFFHITQRVAAEMLKQGSGHIVSITTSLVDHAIAGVPTVLANLTKGGINSATKALAIEYATKGIRVNAVSPGIIKTPMHAPETHEFLAALHPMKRMGEIKDIAEAVMYLESAAFVTGEILHIDGGQSAGH